MDITPHNQISPNHQKRRGRAPRGCRKIINKWKGVKIYQKRCDPWLFIPWPFGNICKQPGPKGITPTMLLWIIPAQDSTHYLRNAKQMANKTNPYWKNRPGRSLLTDTCTRDNHIDVHCNSTWASLSLPEVNLWHHTRTSRIYDC